MSVEANDWSPINRHISGMHAFLLEMCARLQAPHHPFFALSCPRDT